MIDKFFLSQKVWLYFTLCLICSYVLLQFGGDIRPVNYFKWIMYYTIPSIPIFLWIYLRDKNSENISATVKMLTSILVLVAYPLFLFTPLFGSSILKGLSNMIFGSYYAPSYNYMTLVLLFIILEICFLVKEKSEKQLNFAWVKNMTPFMWSSMFVMIFSFLFLLMSHYFSEIVKFRSIFFRIFYFSFCLTQLFVIYISYYLFYEWHYKVLFDKLLKKKGIIFYVLGVAFTLLVFVPIHNFIISLFPVVDSLKLHSMALVPQIMDDFNFALTIFVLTISFPFILLQEWYKKSNAIKELEKQKTSAELNLLKEQINPHFFFNTLNNLYAMSLTNDKETPEVILKLSELMRYVIYKGKEEQVKLIDEVNYIKDYVELQMIRLHNRLDFSFDIKIDDDNWEVSPLLLIIFVENAFKHGVELSETGSQLELKIMQMNDVLEFTCINNYDPENVSGMHGIGLDNLRKRLEILYGSNYKLETDSTDGTFTAYLKIVDEES